MIYSLSTTENLGSLYYCIIYELYHLLKEISINEFEVPPEQEVEVGGRQNQDPERDRSLRTLDLDTSVTLIEAVRAHHKLSRICHPDQHGCLIDTGGCITRMGLTLQETIELNICSVSIVYAHI